MGLTRDNGLIASDLLPEFLGLPELLDGERYVLAKKPAASDGGALHVTSIIATYRAATDSWVFSHGRSPTRSPDDLWILESEYQAALGRAHERKVLRETGALEA